MLGEGAFGKVGKFKIKDNYPSGIPLFLLLLQENQQNLSFVVFALSVLGEVLPLTVLI